jgi:serine protease Do
MGPYISKYIHSTSAAKLIGIGILVAAVGVGYYQYHVNSILEMRVVSLQNRLGGAVESAPSNSKTNASTATPVQAKVTDAPQPTLTSAVAQVVPSVVSIVVSEDVPKLQVQYENPFGDDPVFGGLNIRIPVYSQVGTTTQEVGAGTGFIVRADGYILTNRHVILSNKASFTVLLSDGTKKQAQVAYEDPDNDIALLKIDGSGYPTVSLGDSSTLQLGQQVAAIGNALGQYSNTVSTGIVSGLNRTVAAQDYSGNVEKLTGIIQTDAPINPGNSGGPLLDLSGNVVGINVATVEGSNNISFAIPIDSAKAVIAAHSQ